MLNHFNVSTDLFTMHSPNIPVYIGIKSTNMIYDIEASNKYLMDNSQPALPIHEISYGITSKSCHIMFQRIPYR